MLFRQDHNLVLLWQSQFLQNSMEGKVGIGGDITEWFASNYILKETSLTI